MECDICMLEWDSQKKIPRLLSCGHTFCEVCLISILNSANSKGSDLFCPNCMAKHKDIKKEEDIKNLIKNFNLLRIVEKIESRKTVITNKSFLSGEKNILTESLIGRGLFKKKGSDDPGDDEINLNSGSYSISSVEQKCKKHYLPVHSYAIGTNLLFCDKCVAETNLKTYPLPNVLKDLKRKIDSSQVKICLLKSEIERLKDFFNSYQ